MVNEDQDKRKRIKNGVQKDSLQKSTEPKMVDTAALWEVIKI